MKLELFCQISGENPVFVVGLAEDKLDGCGRGSGFPGIPVWFGFWIALARGVQYAVDHIELQERLLEFFGDGVKV